MDEKTGEALSGLADGELSGEESETILARLRDDEALWRQWNRVHLIRATLAQHLPDRVDPAFADRVSEALRDEPTIMAPNPVPRGFFRGRRRNAALATAASFLVAAIVGFQVLQGPAERSEESPASQTSGFDDVAEFGGQIEARSQLSQVSDRSERGASNVQQTGYQQQIPEHRYNATHLEYSAGSAVQGMVPYLRLAGEGANADE